MSERSASPITLRPATAADAAAVCALHIASIRELCGPDYTREEIESWVMGKTPEMYPPWLEKSDFWVGEVGGEIAGFIMMQPTRDEEVAEIYGLYMSPRFAGRGVGRALVERMLDLARSRGVKRMFLFGTKTARPFYERMGFRMTGTHQHTTRGGAVLDCWRMEREL
jgi:putative acetyltransferase